MSTPYPSEPWDLRGRLDLSLFLVPAADLPDDLPDGWRAVRLARWAVVATAWVRYEPPGVLSYREVMAVVLARRGARVRPTIVRIWVDSEASLAGGRALWGIPKQLASFDFTGDARAARDDDGRITAGTVRDRLRLPGRWPVRFSIVQQLDDAPTTSPVRARGGLTVTTTRLAAAPAGPLAFLAGHRPWLSLTLRDFVMTFGR
ncbi:Acetoacetate decarboxylase (ADC) [Jatrophihabitans endophyticus]|uniref:Acetoacetate decarboxylase (ADC) n=1 Tax=Jatrophihabitans endophyticus TaxID=1206085 RepID=A0A1M5BYU1_9ACTN|nr:acetoacetate decarboxylase family protein [Jatrophihabitans endophyticus]SHF47402.1 Acetoacetate decarboxylase (ADC) [Jatrophihabitans endophyticus]